MNILNPVILCVDDEPGNLKLLERTLVPNQPSKMRIKYQHVLVVEIILTKEEGR